jgi:hypothetical protein
MPQSIGPEADLSVAASCCCQSSEEGASRLQLIHNGESNCLFIKLQKYSMD